MEAKLYIRLKKVSDSLYSSFKKDIASVSLCIKLSGTLTVKPTCSTNSVILGLINPMPRKEKP